MALTVCNKQREAEGKAPLKNAPKGGWDADRVDLEAKGNTPLKMNAAQLLLQHMAERPGPPPATAASGVPPSAAPPPAAAAPPRAAQLTPRPLSRRAEAKRKASEPVRLPKWRKGKDGQGVGAPRRRRRTPPPALSHARAPLQHRLHPATGSAISKAKKWKPQAGSIWNLTEAEAKALGLGWGACPGCGKAGAVTKGLTVTDVTDVRFHRSTSYRSTSLKRHQCTPCGKKDFA
jgi:hypothetical protein